MVNFIEVFDVKQTYKAEDGKEYNCKHSININNITSIKEYFEKNGSKPSEDFCIITVFDEEIKIRGSYKKIMSIIKSKNTFSKDKKSKFFEKRSSDDKIKL